MTWDMVTVLMVCLLIGKVFYLKAFSVIGLGLFTKRKFLYLDIVLYSCVLLDCFLLGFSMSNWANYG